MTSSPSQQQPIVVGVDGSASSQSALHWGARQAALTSAPLRVVIAWALPHMFGGDFDFGYPPTVDLGLEKYAREALARMVTDLPDTGTPPVPVEQIVQEGSPAAVLLERAKGASLLVVGSRGHGAFTGMLLGSVSEHCVSHASCPVVVVRAGEGDQ